MTRFLSSLAAVAVLTLTATGTAMAGGSVNVSSHHVASSNSVHVKVNYSNYHLNYGHKFVGGYYYKSINHKHWSHCYWNSKYGCYYYWCPALSCYYYWYAPADCYYPVTYIIQAVPVYS